MIYGSLQTKPISTQYAILCPYRAVTWTILLTVALFCGTGCNDSSPFDRVIVSGTVTYQGESISDGMVYFMPNEGTEGMQAAGRIVDGTYTVKAKGGVPVGKHRVEILGFGANNIDRGGAPSLAGVLQDKQQFLPAKYNSNSEIERSVEAGKKMTIDFSLE